MMERVARHRVFEDENNLIGVGFGERLRHSELGAEATARRAGQIYRNELALRGVFVVVDAKIDQDVVKSGAVPRKILGGDVLFEVFVERTAGRVALTEQQDDARGLAVAVRKQGRRGVGGVHIQPRGRVLGLRGLVGGDRHAGGEQKQAKKDDQQFFHNNYRLFVLIVTIIAHSGE